MRSSAAFVLALGVSGAACGPGVHDLQDESEVLVTLRARISGTPFVELEDVQDGIPELRAAVLWADVPDINVFCLTYGPNPLEPNRVVTSSVARIACRDPLAFVPGVVGPSVPIEINQTSIEIPLYHLPSADALVGPVTGRVGYASIVVFIDGFENGRLDNNVSCEGDDFREDRVVAASFSTLQDPHERLVYREGDFDETSYFFPAPGCEAPAQGLSVWRVGSLLDGECKNEPVAAGFTLEYAQDSTSLGHMLCRTSQQNGRPEPPGDDPPMYAPAIRDSIVTECLDEETYAVTRNDCRCPYVSLVKLRGCYDALICNEPDWDFTADPPDWWPCGGGD